MLAVFSIIETVVDPLLDFLPGTDKSFYFCVYFELLILFDSKGYLLGKCLFLVWCMAPSDKSGSNLVFTQVVNCFSVGVLVQISLSHNSLSSMIDRKL